MKKTSKEGALAALAIAIFLVFLIKSDLLAPDLFYFKTTTDVPTETELAVLLVPLRIDINSATRENLLALPGIGEVLAERIVKRRSELGGFSSTAELAGVVGIGEMKLAAIESHIEVKGEGEDR